MVKFTLTTLFLASLAALIHLPAPSEKLDAIAKKDAANALQQKEDALHQLVPETRMFTRSSAKQTDGLSLQLVENSIYEFEKTDI